MARGLDHIVHAVRDLDAGAALYRKLGFTVGARNTHPWGTQNHIVQLPGFFVELLGIGDASRIPPHETRDFSFGAFSREFLARHEGLSMLVLEGQGAQADAETFRAAAIGDFAVFDFEREGKRADGTPVKVAFSLAFAQDARAPDIGFFTCQQHYPDNFWNAAFQRHANRVSRIGGAVIVAENPSDHHVFLSAFVGERELQSSSSGVKVTTPRGDIQVMDPSAYRTHFGIEPPSIARGACLAAIRFMSDAIEATKVELGRSQVPHAERMGKLVVGPDVAMGAALVFESAP